ncbi:hypothetical protein MC7420_6937 [Coleofasciculus chthonoplastes PCC 7420]|uniref:Uncharacterized protein n=1 Tax=Coleofasciculus chthonoplastes PCC 7420 TaxID=118168 RepID=B4W1W8_9CYAN|nr:hypothetical protein MC7420_6937 [Coleofasciculus chthonoplastes PCC 7420]
MMALAIALTQQDNIMSGHEPAIDFQTALVAGLDHRFP